MEMFFYGDKSHIRVHPHVKYFLGAAKNVVTVGKNMIFEKIVAKTRQTP